MNLSNLDVMMNYRAGHQPLCPKLGQRNRINRITFIEIKPQSHQTHIGKLATPSELPILGRVDIISLSGFEILDIVLGNNLNFRFRIVEKSCLI